MNDKKMYVFAGPNGSGKSTAINNFINKKKIPDMYICPDNFIAKGEEDNNKNKKARMFCEFLRYKCIEMGISFCFETVLSNPDKIEFIKYAQRNGYKVITFYFVTSDPAINIERVAKRVSEGGHNVPKDIIVEIYYKCMGLMDEVVRISDDAYVYDTSKTEGKPKLLFLKDSWIRKYIHI
ncbi:MAG: zeta toxin family protein [Ruminococcus sp.]|jgi:predicted ABC-type ATPase|nr:zeta toxin family protein [Ruminococcus sp.]